MMGKIEGRRRGRVTEDEMIGWHYQLNGHEFEQAPGDGEGQWSLTCCSPWGHKESDMTEKQQNNLHLMAYGVKDREVPVMKRMEFPEDVSWGWGSPVTTWFLRQSSLSPPHSGSSILKLIAHKKIIAIIFRMLQMHSPWLKMSKYQSILIRVLQRNRINRICVCIYIHTHIYLIFKCLFISFKNWGTVDLQWFRYTAKWFNIYIFHWLG